MQEFLPISVLHKIITRRVVMYYRYYKSKQIILYFRKLYNYYFFYRYSCLIKGRERIILTGATSFLNIIFSRDDFRQVRDYTYIKKEACIKDIKS